MSTALVLRTVTRLVAEVPRRTSTKDGVLTTIASRIGHLAHGGGQ
jgi:hypothetical protein